MKKHPRASTSFFLWVGFLAAAAATTRAAAPDTGAVPALDSAAQVAQIAAFEQDLHYRHGHILLGDGLARLHLDSSDGYLDPAESEKVLSELWGNPPGSQTLGMIFPSGQKATDPGCWAVVVSFEEDGYVKDDDADEIDYDDLLKTMKKDIVEGNEERRKAGYGTLELLGWAEKPRYDKANKKLFWAKSLRFEGSDDETLNYNVRILGRRGVLVLNAVSSLDDLPKVSAGMQPLMQAVEFEAGHRYADFDPKVDKVATYGIAGLVAGAALMKVGFFKGLLALILAGKKFLILGAAGLFAVVSKFFKSREKKEVADTAKTLDDGRA